MATPFRASLDRESAFTPCAPAPSALLAAPGHEHPLRPAEGPSRPQGTIHTEGDR